MKWDEVINDRNNIKVWTKFLHDLGQFRLVNAPKHVLYCEGRDVKFHGFSDISGKAYGPVCLFGSFVSMGVHSVCGQVNVGLFQ